MKEEDLFVVEVEEIEDGGFEKWLVHDPCSFYEILPSREIYTQPFSARHNAQTGNIIYTEYLLVHYRNLKSSTLIFRSISPFQCPKIAQNISVSMAILLLSSHLKPQDEPCILHHVLWRRLREASISVQ
jgi:hypothetical protein